MAGDMQPRSGRTKSGGLGRDGRQKGKDADATPLSNDELRQARLRYLAKSPADRAKLATPVIQAQGKRVDRTKHTSSKTKRERHQTSQRVDAKHRPGSKRDEDDSRYVYGPPAASQAASVQVRPDQGRREVLASAQNLTNGQEEKRPDDDGIRGAARHAGLEEKATEHNRSKSRKIAPGKQSRHKQSPKTEVSEVAAHTDGLVNDRGSLNLHELGYTATEASINASTSRELPSRPSFQRRRTTSSAQAVHATTKARPVTSRRQTEPQSKPAPSVGTKASRDPDSVTVVSSRDYRRRSDTLLGSLMPFSKTSKAVVECGICTKQKRAARTIETKCCKTTWCYGCVKRAYNTTLTDPLVKMPRCCGEELPIKQTGPVLLEDKAWCLKWNKLMNERQRTDGAWCTSKKCRAYIPHRLFLEPRPGSVQHHDNGGRALATCQKCGTKVCGRCKKGWHEGKTCPDTPEEKAFEQLMLREGWQTCLRCGIKVEKTYGCNHMSCPCGHEFCYRCGRDYTMSHQCPPELALKEEIASAEASGDMYLAEQLRRRAARGSDYYFGRDPVGFERGWNDDEPRATLLGAFQVGGVVRTGVVERRYQYAYGQAQA